MSKTPRTDALFERHCKEAHGLQPVFAADVELALRQAKELLAHARWLEAEIEELGLSDRDSMSDEEVEPFDETNENHIELACNGVRFDSGLLDLMVALRSKDAEALLLAAKELRKRLKDSYEDNV